MKMNEAEKFKLFCGKGREYEFKTSDGQAASFYFEPLDAMYIGDLLELVSIAQKMNVAKEQGNASDTTLSKEYVTKAIELIKIMIRQSYDESVLPENILNKFVATNYLRLLEILFELNSDMGGTQLSEESQAKIQELKEKVKSNDIPKTNKV